MLPASSSIADSINAVLAVLNTWLYSYILIALLIGAGLYFFIRTKGLPVRMFRESIRVVTEPPEKEGQLSSFRALMVSTASRVGVGNIAGVGTAVALGGAGSVFWMWVIATLGAASAFIESTLAQIYKKRGHSADDHSIGGLHPDRAQAALACSNLRNRIDPHLHGWLQPAGLVQRR